MQHVVHKYTVLIICSPETLIEQLWKLTQYTHVHFWLYVRVLVFYICQGPIIICVYSLKVLHYTGPRWPFSNMGVWTVSRVIAREWENSCSLRVLAKGADSKYHQRVK